MHSTQRVVLATVLACGVLSPTEARQALTVPAGTAIPVRMLDRVTSDGLPSLMEYKASVDDAVIVGDATLIPRGATAYLRVIEVQDAGAVKGRASVSVRLVGVVIGRERLNIATGDAIKVESGSQAGQAVKSGAVGAVVGGLLGGLLGGKDGLKKGAATGAAAGVATAIVRGKEVRIPPETRMTFTVDRPSTSSTIELSDDVIRDELVALEQAAFVASVAGNRAVIDAMLAPEFVTSVNGKLISRKDYLGKIKAQKNMIDASFEDVVATREANEATLTGYGVIRQRDGKGIKIIRQKFRDVFVLMDGAWKLRWSEVVSQ